MTSDGQSLRQSWSNALNDALTSFRSHLTSAQSSSWKRVSVPARESLTPGKGKTRASPEPADVVLHRKSTKTGEIYRVLVDVALGDEQVDLEAWKAVLVTPELRQEWDPAVESSQLIEMFDPATTVVKTKFTLGWPANPRDAVMISRAFSDATTVIDISTSLPRSADEPSYLRPSPPYVRSHVDLFAWCVQLMPASTQSAAPGEAPLRKNSAEAKLRITCFWQHDLRALWNFNTTSSLSQQLPAMVLGLLTTVKKRGSRVSVLTGYGLGVSIERTSYDVGREALTVEYAIIPEDPDATTDTHETLHGLDELYTIKEQRRLERSIECILPSADGWDIRITTRASSNKVAQLPWSAVAHRVPQTTDSSTKASSKISFLVKHSALIDEHSMLKAKISIELSDASKGVRLNGVAHPVEELEARDPVAFSMSNQLTQDASSAVEYSFNTASSVTSVESEASTSSTPRKPPLVRNNSLTARTPAAEKSILSRVRRNYIYFSSLLQEPEAKWKRNTEARGVSVTQLDSIDPTLVVYRAEATFVGVGLWDLYSAVVTPGARMYWDKQFEDATLIEDVNELTELWHYKTRPAWPVVGRDAVLLKTVYKSPTTVHVFAFSVDEPQIFPPVPLADPSVIRTQVDLQGWAIEALSPTTTLITLLEQSDPKGWSGKSTIPQQMIANVAGVGEFAIKCGGPPVVTRLAGARANNIRYEHERGNFRVEYESSQSRRAAAFDAAAGKAEPTMHDSPAPVPELATSRSSMPMVECELRCDIDTWATSLDIVIDPPPQSISCLRRHRLSAGGGGLWLTFGHDSMFAADERLLAIVRRAPLSAGKEKGVVMVNGKRMNVDVEEIADAEVKLLSKQKRVKPVRVPLDQPPVLGVIRRRRAELGGDAPSEENLDYGASASKAPSMWKSTAPRFPSPLASFFTAAYEQATSTTQQAMAAFTPPIATVSTDTSFPPAKLPMHHALDALAFVQGFHRGTYRDNWTQVTDKGLPVHRRVSPEISPVIPVHKGEKVIESVTAEEVASAIATYDCRKRWDDRFDSVTVFEEFGANCHTSFVVTKGGFPFRDRGFYLASLIARGTDAPALKSAPPAPQSPSGQSTVIFCVSASFNPESVAAFAPAKYNAYVLPVGRMYVDAWILETLDPYTTENYAIPSTRCTRVVAVDYSGSVPVAVNSMINSTLPRSILALEAHVKGLPTLPLMRLPASGMLVARDDDIDRKGDAWALQGGDPCRALINTHYTAETKMFRGSVAISLGKSAPPESTQEIGTPKGKSSPALRSESPDTVRQARANSVSSPNSTPRHRRTSSSAHTTPSGSLAIRSRSRDAHTLRSSTSLFSLTKEFKLHGDFIVAEAVVDSKLYPDGYELRISSRVLAGDVSSKPIALSTVWSPDDSAAPAATPENALPIATAIYALPTSALQPSGGLTVDDKPTRQLVRLTLPTAQYDAPEIQDPLTGEMRVPPARPTWLRELEESGRRAIVCVEVRAASLSGPRKKKSVMINGVAVAVGAEKDAPKPGTDEGIGPGVLLRIPQDDGADSVPKQLSAPLAVADQLYDAGAISSRALATVTESVAGEAGQASDEPNKEAKSPPPADLTDGEEKPGPPLPEPSHGLLGFLHSYQNPLLRFTAAGASTASASVKAKVKAGSVTGAASASAVAELPQGSALAPPRLRRSASSLSESVVRVATAPQFSLSTLFFAGMIAFLLGSLLRSLLSPADFIYVVHDLREAPVGTVEPGWREIRRLFEIKYILGGWDFQVAAVRRH